MGSIDIDKLLKDPAFRNIGEDQIAAIRSFSQQIEGKNPAEITALFMQYSKRFMNGKTIAKDERDAIVSVISASLPDDDRKKFNMVLSLIK